jgi:hypothetical protein
MYEEVPCTASLQNISPIVSSLLYSSTTSTYSMHVLSSYSLSYSMSYESVVTREKWTKYVIISVYTLATTSRSVSIMYSTSTETKVSGHNK